jgi:hypothetical protein
VIRYDKINAADPKNMKMRCAVRPHRAWTISSQVCAYGALSLSLAASWFDGVSMCACRAFSSVHTCAKRRTWTVAPAPYHHGPEIPYLYATALDWSCRQCRASVDHCLCQWGLTRVAAHVQAETIPEAIRPGLTLRDALLNSSVLFGENAVYRA